MCGKTHNERRYYKEGFRNGVLVSCIGVFIGTVVCLIVILAVVS